MKNIAQAALCLLLSYETVAQRSGILTSNKLKTATDSIVDKAAQPFMHSPQRVGLSIGIYKSGRFYTYHYGEVEKGKQQLPANNTLYAIASISKTFTSILLAQAIVDKKVKPYDDIRTYLNGYYANLEYQGKPIRLLDLTNHTSGLPFFLPDVPEIFTDTTLSPADIAMKMNSHVDRKVFYEQLHKVKLDTVPGTRFKYSNSAVILLGFILERVYEMPFEKLLKAHLLLPLQMRHTKITMHTNDNDMYAKGYDLKGNAVPNNTEEFQAAGGIKSNILDMLKYVRWNVEEKDDAVKLSHWPFWPTNWEANDTFSVGLNWQMLKINHRRVIWQEGNLPGYNSYCVAYPESKMGIVVLTNESDRHSSLHILNMINQIMKTIDSNAISLY